MRTLFEMARERKPAIIFIDEIDSMCGERGAGTESESARRIKTEFLVQMQGVSNNMEGVLVLAATNTPWEIDSAMRRRFEKRIYIPLPDAPARALLFPIALGSTPHNLVHSDMLELGGACSEGMSGSDVSVLVREALMEPLRKCRIAKFWEARGGGKWTPSNATLEQPPCVRCVPSARGSVCGGCGCLRGDMMDLTPDALLAPDVTMADFRTILAGKGGRTSVASRELVKYTSWTSEFGSEGA